jgi:di/tricarboxylate transporter
MMDMVRALIEAHQAWLAMAILAAMFIAFMRERYPASVIAIFGATMMLALGILDSNALFGVFSNSAPIIIAAMFVLSGALMRTGVIERIATQIIVRARKRPRLAILEVLAGALVASAFLNNTPVVVVLIPVMARLAAVTGISPKKLLMPLSIVAVMGGCLTLIGTSTNLVVDGIARDAGLAGFGIFDILPYGLAAAAAGVATLTLLWWVLPSDHPVRGPAGATEAQFLTEVEISSDDPELGKSLAATGFGDNVLSLVGVRRGAAMLSGNEANDAVLTAGDRLILRTDGSQLMTLHETRRSRMGIGSGEPDASDTVIEAMISPSHPAIGRRLAEIPFLSRVRARIIGVERPGHIAGPDLSNLRIRPADRLVITAPADQLPLLRSNPHLLGLDLARTRAYRPAKAWIAVSALAGAVLLSAFDIIPIGIAAVLAVAIILAARCIDSEEAWSTIDGDVLILIFAMLAVGVGLERSGAVAMAVNATEPWLADMPAWALIFAVYFIALILSELLSNNAVAALLTPVTIALAAQIGADPRPLVIAVMLGASLCFATPVGYQTNTIVYAAGDYRFMDFVKIGVPLNIATGLAACSAIALLG